MFMVEVYGKKARQINVQDLASYPGPLVSSIRGQVEQGAHYIRKSLIYSMRKAFLEKAVVELVVLPRMFEKVSRSLSTIH